ncbi:hypothetical protein [Planktothrix agardhii]|jgi:hypothetical protein|uniref:hypothetical protein n=1 Tax=Planktothrix agardhii TaxID=1160 RepID=UPI000DBB81EC|nr:hypothetical protein [Planktothrix agardhii]BBD53467.1 hypothetical protein NIES204_07410 [Planktothrix agardhii NIES-204]MCB8787933.1 hypothetical protein [Planktothrix agardhii 1025]MCF3578565.1 hypothetical protein [Planktothrix agardhii 1812]MCF3610299.1 hypothetical protein [Planktothrix agardhii 1027]MCF3643896.1 hypothetical protein [Planktothrix agardhii 1026]
MTNLSFFAQNLDNKSRDIIIQNGEELYNDESRRKLVFEISEVRAKKIEIALYGPSVTVRHSDPKFVMEVIPVEKDESNRLAPIVIYGEFPEEGSSDWVNNVCNEIQGVISNQIKRTLQNGTLESIKKWLNDELEAKKKKVQFQRNLISLSTSFFLPLAVSLLLQFQGWQLTLLQIGGLIGLINLLVMSLQIFLINSHQSKFNLK